MKSNRNRTNLLFGLCYLTEWELGYITLKQLEEIRDKEGLEVLYKKALEIDPKAMEKISPNDYKRITRVLEIYEATGKAFNCYTGNLISTAESLKSGNQNVFYKHQEFLLQLECVAW